MQALALRPYRGYYVEHNVFRCALPRHSQRGPRLKRGLFF